MTMADILDTIAESNREIVRKNKEIKPMTKVMDEAFACGRGDLAFEKALAKEGLGYLLTFDKLINTSPGSGLVFRPLEPALETVFYLIWGKDQTFTPIAERFLEHMKGFLVR